MKNRNKKDILLLGMVEMNMREHIARDRHRDIWKSPE